MSAAHFHLIEAATRKAGAALPDSLTGRLAQIRDVAASDLGIGRHATAAELVTATTAALDAGRDPYTDKAVTAALARHQLATAMPNWASTLNVWAEQETTATLAAHAEALLDDWSERIGQAGASLAEALQHLDATPTLEDQAASALRAGGTRGEAWRTAARSLEVIDNLANAWRYLATMTLGLVGFNPDRGGILLRNPSLTLGQLANIPNRCGTWELAANHGVTITGATLDEYRAAVARLAGEIQADAERDGTEQARQAWGQSLTGADRGQQ